jgi:hypothetical protein
MEVSDQLHAPAALFPRKEPLDTRLGGPQSRSWRCGEEKVSQPIAQRYTTELSRLDLYIYLFNLFIYLFNLTYQW